MLKFGALALLLLAGIGFALLMAVEQVADAMDRAMRP